MCIRDRPTAKDSEVVRNTASTCSIDGVGLALPLPHRKHVILRYEYLKSSRSYMVITPVYWFKRRSSGKDQTAAYLGLRRVGNRFVHFAAKKEKKL